MVVHFKQPLNYHHSRTAQQARDRTTAPNLDLSCGQIVKPTMSAKLLGVYLDSQLQFADYLDQINKKCTKSLQAISTLR